MRQLALSAILVLGLVRSAPAAGPYDDLLKRTPANTNSLVLIDVKGAMNSPLARAEKWRERATASGRGGLGFVPPDAELVVIAGEVNLTTLVRDFQVGLVKVPNTPTMRELAAREGGTADEIAGRLSVLSPRDVYFTTLSAQELAAIYPAYRQYTARYIKAALASKSVQLSPYLQKAAASANGNTLTIALDLEDVVDRTIVKMSLPSSPAVAKTKGLDINLLSSLVASVKGLTVAVQVTNTIKASVTVEFRNDPSVFKRTLPDLFRELIEGQGIAIEGFESWQATFTETTMTLTGTLNSLDLKRLVSLFAFPQPAGEGDPTMKGNQPSVAKTKRYLTAVDAILTDIKSTRDSKNYNKTATWHEKAAAQIEQLSKQGVDPAAVDAAFEAAKRLRAIGSSLRGLPIDLDALANQQYYSARPSLGVMPGGWWGWQPFIFGPTHVDTNIPEIQSKMTQTIANDQKRRLEAWSQIDRTMMDARRKLSEKYKVDF
jgi:hypothetical protein